MCIFEGKHLSFSLTNQLGIPSITATWYNRVRAQFERSNIPALIFTVRSQSELNPLNFFVLIEMAF